MIGIAGATAFKRSARLSAQCQWIMFSWKVPPTTNSPGPIIMVTTTTIVKEVGRQFAFVGGSAACRESSSPWTCSSSSAGRSQFWVVPIQSKGCRPLRCCNSRPPAAAILRVRAGCSPRARQWLCRSGTCWRPHRCDRGLLATVDSCPPSLPTGGVTSFVRSCTKYLAACCTSCSAATGNRGREASSTSPTTADGPGLEDGLALTGIQFQCPCTYQRRHKGTCKHSAHCTAPCTDVFFDLT